MWPTAPKIVRPRDGILRQIRYDILLAIRVGEQHAVDLAAVKAGQFHIEREMFEIGLYASSHAVALL